MPLTDEQQAVVDAALANHIVKVIARAGTGKTHTLVAIAEALKPERGIYMAYNKSIALEAKQKFPYYIDCRTVHSLAYMYIMANSSRTIEFFTPSCIEEPIPYNDKLNIIATIEEFYLSDAVELSWLSKQLEAPYDDIAKKYVKKMQDNEIPCTFSFLLKYFHLQLLFGTITPNEVDLLMLDEAGDTSGVIVEIFKLFPAKKKVMVGDPEQNIYAFAYTVDGFKNVQEGVTLPLTKSFRVSPRIASDIQSFCVENFCPSMVFHGTEQENKVIKSKAYIARTNSYLIARAIELNKTDTVYSFTREPKEIFSLLLTVMNLKEDSLIYDKRYKYLPEALRCYNNEPHLQQQYTSFLSFLSSTYCENDPALRATIGLLFKYKFKELYDTYNRAKAMPKRANIVLTTAHSAKGLEFDEVYIEDDLNKTVEKNKLKRHIDVEALTEFRLYYVACTRARLSLLNAKELLNVEDY